MKAALMTAYGAPLSVEDVPAPEIQAPDDVVVRVAGAGVCGSDVHLQNGALVPTLGEWDLPYLLGHENVGHVEAVGEGVRGFEPGDPVVLHPLMSCGLCGHCRSGNDMYCTDSSFPGVDGVTPGGFAELMRTSVRTLVKLAPGTDPVPLAPYADAGLTAYHAVKKLVPLVQVDDIVVVVGTGGVGQFALQLLHHMTAGRIVATDVVADRVDAAKGLGADVVFQSSAEGGNVERLLEATGGTPAAFVVDCMGGAGTPAEGLDMLRRGGVYSAVGASEEVVPLSTVRATGQEITVVGNFVGSYRDLLELIELERRGLVTCDVRRYRLDDAQQAMDDLESGKLVGRGVLVP